MTRAWIAAGRRRIDLLLFVREEPCVDRDAAARADKTTAGHVPKRQAEGLARGFPIATGLIKGGHRIQERLGITGARWGVAGAKAILKLRTSFEWRLGGPLDLPREP